MSSSPCFINLHFVPEIHYTIFLAFLPEVEDAVYILLSVVLQVVVVSLVLYLLSLFQVPLIDFASIYCTTRICAPPALLTMFSSSKGKRDMRTVWGYTFEWTPQHQTSEQMRPLTYSYDVLGAQCLDRLDELSPPTATKTPSPPETADCKEEENSQRKESQDKNSQNPSPPTPRRDLYALFMAHHTSDPLLQALHTSLHTKPSWASWDQLARGQAVFYRYGGPSILALTFQSLLGGMAGARVVQTLARTGAWSAISAKRRLLETFQHLLQVTSSVDALKPGGDGFAASVRVRLLHASVRRRILKLAKEKEDAGKGGGDDYFDVDEWGVPINDLDSLGTILSFSAALVWIGLPRQGIFLAQAEIDDLLALWRYVGHLLGLPADLSAKHLADWRAAKVLFESLILAELVPTEGGGVLANNIITSLSGQPPAFASREFMCAEARWLNGAALCDALGIARPPWWYGVLVGAQCLYFCVVCYVKRLVPAWDERNREVGALLRWRRFPLSFWPCLAFSFP